MELQRRHVDPPDDDTLRPHEPSKAELRCKRCRKRIDEEERDSFYARLRLCFWCAYVDPQG